MVIVLFYPHGCVVRFSFSFDDFGRKCSSGNTSQLSGLEGEENDTAASTSNYLCVAAIT